MHIKQVLLFALGLSYAVLSHAETYEWVDEKGVTNYGDSVPAKYKNKAKAVEIKENVISAPVIPKIKKVDSNQPEQSEPIVLEKPPVRDPNKADESCEVQVQKYKESQNCFAQYRNVRGGINEEGVKRCTAVQQPSCSTDRN
ncbi:MAG: DUF4124 domain-containing protein [Pseudomonadota bacterium]